MNTAAMSSLKKGLITSFTKSKHLVHIYPTDMWLNRVTASVHERPSASSVEAQGTNTACEDRETKEMNK